MSHKDSFDADFGTCRHLVDTTRYKTRQSTASHDPPLQTAAHDCDLLRSAPVRFQRLQLTPSDFR